MPNFNLPTKTLVLHVNLKCGHRCRRSRAPSSLLSCRGEPARHVLRGDLLWRLCGRIIDFKSSARLTPHRIIGGMLFQWQVDISERWQLDPNQVLPKALTTDDSSPATDCLVNSELVMLAVIVVILALCIGAVVMVMTTLPVTHTPDTVFVLGGVMVLAV